MKKLFIFAVALCACFFVAPSLMFAEAKNALLIANASYSTAPLSTPIQESRGLKKTLEKLGFAVTIVENGGREKMLDALDDFGRLLKNKGGVGFFHYGGHAVQFNGKNYLIPVDADISDERRVSTRAVDLDDVMFSMAAETNIVILDSCRDNPFPSASRGTSRGLALSYVKPKNSIIVYSAEAGKKAQDGVFTPILTQKLLQKKSLVSILTEVRREVNKATGGMQLPKNDDGLLDDVYLAGFSDAPTPAPAVAVSAPEPVRAPIASNEKMQALIESGKLEKIAEAVFNMAQNKAGTNFPKYTGDYGDGKIFTGLELKNGYVLGYVFTRKIYNKVWESEWNIAIVQGDNFVRQKDLDGKIRQFSKDLKWKMRATGVQPQEFLERKKMFVTEVGLLEWLSDYENASDELAVVLKAFK